MKKILDTAETIEELLYMIEGHAFLSGYNLGKYEMKKNALNAVEKLLNILNMAE